MKTIKGKLIAAISAAAVIILLTGSIGSYLIANSVVSRKVKELQLEKAMKIAEEMDGWLAEQIAWVEENVDTYELRMQEESYEEIKSYLAERLARDDGTIMDAYYGFEDKTMLIINSEVGDDYNCCERGWYMQAKEADAMVVTNPYVDAFTGNIVVTVAAPIHITIDAMTNVVNSSFTTLLGITTPTVQSQSVMETMVKYFTVPS